MHGIRGGRLPNEERLHRGLWWGRALTVAEGCSYVSEGCRNCWAADQTHIRSHQSNQLISDRYSGLTNHHGKWNGLVRVQPKALEIPHRLKQATIFAVWNDLFHPGVPFSYIKDVLDSMLSDNNNHVYVILTKRPERARQFFQLLYEVEFDNYFTSDNDCQYVLLNSNNIIIGTSIESDKYRDRIYILNDLPFKNKVISYEPALDKINWNEVWDRVSHDFGWWLLIGAESGPKKRPCPFPILESAVASANKYDIPIFMKQIDIDGKIIKDINKFPPGFQRREFLKLKWSL